MTFRMANTRWRFCLGACALCVPLAAQEAVQPVATAIGIGVQIYTCGDGGRLILTAPEATLYVERNKVGEHSAGPRWTWMDGSAVTGKVVKSTPSSAPEKNISWLELEATAVPGASTGVLSGVTRVTRTETQGGVVANSACEVKGETLRVPYAATYRFFVK